MFSIFRHWVWIGLWFVVVGGVASGQEKGSARSALFPRELVAFGAATEKPLLAGGGERAWDRSLRERGWILREDGVWHLWYTGYNDALSKDRYLGYATSPDGITWTRWSDQPLTRADWIEDVCVWKEGTTYYLFAEGRDDIAQLWTSQDRVHWLSKGPLDIRQTNGDPISAGPRGTPTVWFEKGTWWLFYERRDQAVYLATSQDLVRWTHVQDEPVLERGPEAYDRYAVAIDQILKYGDRYYAYYHASALPQWGEWSTCVASSTDLIHWTKYEGNPMIPVNPAIPGAGSGMAIHDGKNWRFYTSHPDLRLYLPPSP